MAFEKKILGLIDPRREIRRAPLIGMEFLHKGSVGFSDVVRPRPRLKPQHFVGLLFRHRAASRRMSAPPARVALSVFTPAGRPAVQISFK